MAMIDRYKDEIERAGLLKSDSDYGGMLGTALMRLCETMCAEGHSGFSHGMTTGMFHQLMTTGILTPLTGEPSEWTEVMAGCFQNKRASNVFMDLGGAAYQFDYYVFHDGKGAGGYTSRRSRKYISFPYTPSHEHVTVGRLRRIWWDFVEWWGSR